MTIDRIPALLALFFVSCAPPTGWLHRASPISTNLGQFTIESTEEDQREQQRVRQSLDDAVMKLNIWGGPRYPIRILILPSHRELEKAVDKPGLPWLKAWARYDEIFLQSPRTWESGEGTQADLDLLLLHELAHCVMYQRSATRTNWHRKQIPVWFREGMASYTARQGNRYASLEDLARFYEAHPNRDPLLGSEDLYREQSAIVYGAAHHAFTFLVDRFGRDSVSSLMSEMASGPAFPEAFHEVLGISVKAFSDEFERFVQSRGFREAHADISARPCASPRRPD